MQRPKRPRLRLLLYFLLIAALYYLALKLMPPYTGP
jgi:hypothetical protein